MRVEVHVKWEPVAGRRPWYLVDANGTAFRKRDSKGRDWPAAFETPEQAINFAKRLPNPKS